jgi:hypothetical protein
LPSFQARTNPRSQDVNQIGGRPPYGIDDIYEIWNSDPLFYPVKPPAHGLMVAEIAGEVLMVPLAPSDHDDPTRCRPIGCYLAAKHLADRYKEDRRPPRR